LLDVALDNFGVLQVEPTDHCNLKCRMCAPHHDGWEQVHGVAKGFMDLELYRRVVQGLADEDCRFDHLIFQWLGDPSLHPQLEEMVAIAQDHLVGRVNYLRIDTNAIVLTPARMERLVEVYSRCPELPLLVVFTLDAVTEATYADVKGADALARVRRNVRHFIMQRARLPKDARLNVQLQFVVQDGNAEELGDFVAYWSDVLRCHGQGRGYSEIMVKRLSVGAGGEGQRAADDLYERACREQQITEERREHVHIKVWNRRPWESTVEQPGPRQACPGLWATPVIRHDGTLMMCCADLPGELALGSLAEHSFRELWEGDVALKRRLDHIEGRFEGACATCGGINWYKTTPEVIAHTLEQAGSRNIR
jgi:MoaA/NifB/PqqE/SkfB family radical SAM enzyme